MKPIEEQLPEILRKYSEYWAQEEHDVDFASSLINYIPGLVGYIYQLRGALGYNVPGYIKDNPDIVNGIAEAQRIQLEEVRQENERLQEHIELLERKGYV